MPARVQRHAHNRVAGFQQRHINAGVRLTAGMRLYIDKTGVKQLFGAFDGQVLNHVDKLAAAIIPFGRVTLRIFVGQNRPLGFQYRL